MYRQQFMDISTSRGVFFIGIAFIFSMFASQVLAHDHAVPSDPNKTCPIKVGQTIPNLSLKGIDGKTVEIAKILGDKPSILIFYRGSWCPYCNVHLGELAKIEPKLKKLGYQIIAVSPDLPKHLKESVDKNELGYTLLSDSKISLAKALGLAFKVDDDTFKMLKGYNIDIESASGEKHRVLPVPAAIVVNKKREVEFIFSSPNYKTRINTKVLLAAAEASAE